jgi:hypothetical protein
MQLHDTQLAGIGFPAQRAISLELGLPKTFSVIRARRFLGTMEEGTMPAWAPSCPVWTMAITKLISTAHAKVGVGQPAAVVVAKHGLRRRPLAGCLPGLVVSGWMVIGVVGQGIPEPDLVVYGEVINVWQGESVPVEDGVLSWSYQQAGIGAAVLFSTQLEDLEGEFSYVLRVPCETQIAGFPSMPGTLPLTPGGATFNRSDLTWNGHPVSFVIPAQATTSVSTADRGRIERVDLTISVEIEGGGNGLPVDWQLQYFGRTGVDPLADPDSDGSNTRAEYLAGTDPTDAGSALAFVAVEHVGGANRLEWSSVLGRSYTVERSTSASGGFAGVAFGVTATPPTNVWTDEAAPGSGPYFYRLRLEP